MLLLNVEGYWDGLLQWINKAAETGFVGGVQADIIVEAHSAREVLRRLQNYETAKGRLELDWKDEQ